MEQNVTVEDKLSGDASSLKDKALIIIFAFLLGIIFNYFFYSSIPGISYFLFNAMLLGFFMYSAKDRINFKNIWGNIMLSIILLLSATFFLYSNMFLLFLNLVSIPFLIVAYTIIVTNKEADWSHPIFILDMLDRIFIKALSNIFKPMVLLKKHMEAGRVSTNHKAWRNIGIGIAVSLPILLIVVPLLASADMAFEYYISHISSVMNKLNLNTLPGHIVLISIIFLYVLGYAWSFKYKNSEIKYGPKVDMDVVEPQIVMTVLVVINLVYLLFTAVQFSYLYAGGKLPGSFTYSEYARRGFFELVLVTVINLFIMILSLKLMKRENAALVSWINILLSLMVGFTINMLYSAYLRMTLYEESFGYTGLRVYVHVFMLFMFIVFIISLARVWNRRVQLFKASFICGALLYVVLNLINVEGFIAQSNIKRYFKTGKIDTQYLSSLSWDAVPEIIKFTASENSTEGLELKSKLAERISREKKEYKWMEYNYSRSRAIYLINKYSDKK